MIIVNGRFLTHKMDGISRFSYELCRQLKINGVRFKIVVPKWVELVDEQGFEVIRYGKLKSHFWEQIDLYRFLKKNDSPILINLSGLGPLFYKNQIITIHDLSFFANPRWFSRAYTWFYKLATPIVAQSAKKIITVSEFSKSEIIKYLNVDRSKITVIHNAVANELVDKNLAEKFIEEKYVLAVSSIDPRKNLQRLLNVFAEPELQNMKLVLVGKKAEHFNVKLKQLSQNVVFTGYVSDEDLKKLYKNSELFIYPSLYEGFGIPPLEAMSNNSAVILSNIPSLKEIFGDAADYVDPYNESEIKQVLLRCLSSNNIRDTLKQKGMNKSTEYSWEKSGNSLISLIDTINV